MNKNFNAYLKIKTIIKTFDLKSWSMRYHHFPLQHSMTTNCIQAVTFQVLNTIYPLFGYQFFSIISWSGLKCKDFKIKRIKVLNYVSFRWSRTRNLKSQRPVFISVIVSNMCCPFRFFVKCIHLSRPRASPNIQCISYCLGSC